MSTTSSTVFSSTISSPSTTSSTSAPPSTVTFSNLQNCVKLTTDNYPVWKYAINPFLIGNSFLRFVDGSSPPPSPTIPNLDPTAGASPTIANPEFHTWSQQDQMVLSLLIQTLTDPLLYHIVGCLTARDLWLSLEKMFTSTLHARVMHMHYQLATMKKGNLSVTDYFQKIKASSDILAATRQPLNNFEFI